MAKRRLGVALLVPFPFDREVDGLRRAVEDTALARIPPHLTLVPPVNVRDDRLDGALAVLRDAASRSRPLTLTLGPPATFLPDNPVLLLAVGGDPAQVAALRQLREAVFTGPLHRSLTWPFVPHVTLADGAPEDRIRAAVGSLAGYRIEATFDRVHLLEEGPGRRWSPIADAVLEVPAVIGRGGLELELTLSEGLDPEAAAFVRREWPAPEAGSDSVAEAPLVLTARRDGRLVGVARGRLAAAAGDAGGSGHLSDLVVAAAERGTGVGTHLLAAFSARVAAAGCSRVTTHAPAGSPAEAFYVGRGWVKEMHLPRWRRERDFVRLVRRL